MFDEIESTTPPPPERHAHAATVSHNRLLIFFGIGPTGLLSDVWTYDPATKAWLEQRVPGGFTPESRSHHSAVALPDDHPEFPGDVFIYGGLNQDGQPLGDLFQFHRQFSIWSPRGTTGTEAPNPPGPRYGHSAMVLRNKMVVCSGHDGKPPLNDL